MASWWQALEPEKVPKIQFTYPSSTRPFVLSWLKGGVLLHLVSEGAGSIPRHPPLAGGLEHLTGRHVSAQGSPPDLARPLPRPRDFAGRLVAAVGPDPAQDRRQIRGRLANLDRRLRESPAGRFDLAAVSARVPARIETRGRVSDQAGRNVAEVAWRGKGGTVAEKSGTRRLLI